MAENKNNFDTTVASLFKGMDSFVSAKTVVGDAVTVNDTIILPLVDVSFGVGAGAFAGEKKNNAGGVMTGKVSPSAVLVIQNGTTKLVNIKNQDTVTKLLDMVPDLIERFTGEKKESKENEKEAYLKIICGEEPPEYFDIFVRSWQENGGAQITDEVKAALAAE